MVLRKIAKKLRTFLRPEQLDFGFISGLAIHFIPSPDEGLSSRKAGDRKNAANEHLERVAPNKQYSPNETSSTED